VSLAVPYAGSDDLTLTQEFLAQMLGVRRPSVSLVANTLQKAGLIKYARGKHPPARYQWSAGKFMRVLRRGHYKRLLSD